MKTISNQDSVSAFTMTLTNGTNGALKWRLFDADDVLQSINGSLASATATTLQSNNALRALEKTTSATPIVISGFNYQARDNASQFAESFDISRGSVDGRVVKHPNIIAKAKRNTQYDSKLLTIDERFVVDGQTGIEVNVLASEKVTLVFFVEGFLV
jgi:hypothetical protein